MSGLTEFLLARIAEDEAVAREAGLDDPTWQYAATSWGAMQIESSDGTNITNDWEGLTDSVQAFAGPHIARHDPARVLAACKAKRRIVAEHGECGWNEERRGGLQDAIRILAETYADHPDYRDEWRP